MKIYRYLYSATAIIILASASPRKSFSQELWRGFFYGDKADVILKKFPDASQYEFLDHYDKNIPIKNNAFRVDGFGTKRCPLLVDFVFKNGDVGLTSIHVRTDISFLENSQVMKNICAQEIFKDLSEKYGKPNSSGFYQTKAQKIDIWSRPDNIYIEYLYIDFLDIDIKYSKDLPKKVTEFRDIQSAL